MTKLDRHYLWLFLAFVPMGPLMPLALLCWAQANDDSLAAGGWLSFYLSLMTAALITGAVVWGLKLRRSWRSTLATLFVHLLAVHLYGSMGRFFSSGADGLYSLLLLAVLLPALPLALALPRPPVRLAKKRPDPWQKQYDQLRWRFLLTGPLFALPPLAIYLGLFNGWRLGELLLAIPFLYLLYVLPALGTVALARRFQLRCDFKGGAAMVGLSLGICLAPTFILSMFMPAIIHSTGIAWRVFGYLSTVYFYTLVSAPFIAFSACCLSFYLPEPVAPLRASTGPLNSARPPSTV